MTQEAEETTTRVVALHSRILLGLGVGTLAGGVANLLLGGNHPWVEGANHYVAAPVGQLFLRLLLLFVMPLVFVAMSLGVVGLGDLRRVGRIGVKAIVYFAASTAVAVVIGLLMVVLVRPGERISPDTRAQLMAIYASDASGRVEAAGVTTFGGHRIVSVSPRHVFRAAVDLDLLAVLVVALVFGAALSRLSRERAKPTVDLLQSLHDVALRIVAMTMWFAPFGVACLMFGMTSRFGFDVLRLLGWFVATVVGALAVHVLVALWSVIRFAVGMSPVVFFSRCRVALATAFSTSSSSATLPASLAAAEQQLGIPTALAGFVLPLGNVLCMNGTALYQGVTVVALAQAFGVPLGMGQMMAVMVVASVTSVGVAGVPGGSIPVLIALLSMFGVPSEAIALVLGVDRVLDMARTSVNVCGDLTATALIARTEQVWDPSMVPDIEHSRFAHT